MESDKFFEVTGDKCLYSLSHPALIDEYPEYLDSVTRWPNCDNCAGCPARDNIISAEQEFGGLGECKRLKHGKIIRVFDCVGSVVGVTWEAGE
jgi:hypothetical protein